MSRIQPTYVKMDAFYSDFYSTKFTTVITTLFVVMYGSLAYPSEKLPNSIKNAFKNPQFRILVLAFIMYQGNRDTSLSLALAIAFTLIMNHLNKLEIEEIERNQAKQAAKQVAKPTNRTR